MVTIGTVKSLNAAQNYGTAFDDRQERIETFAGVVVQDYGTKGAGDTISFTADFWSKDFFPTLLPYWYNRQKVDFIDDAGNTWQSMRVVIKRYSYVSRFENAVVNADIELWRV